MKFTKNNKSTHCSFTTISQLASQYFYLFEIILNVCHGRITMYSNKMKLAAKAASSVVVAMSLMLSAAGLASAASSPGTRFSHHDVASSRFSRFEYARIGEGGLVTAVTSTSVTVDRWDGKVTTYTITPTTTFTEGSSPTTAASLVVGDRINIRLARKAPTTALKINIELAELAGTVSSVVGNVITITGPQGFARAILVSSTTTFTQGGVAATLADVAVGDALFAKGTIDPNLTTLDALSVKIGSTTHAVTYHGLVTAVTSTSVTVNRLNGVTAIFAITPSTVFSQGANILTAASLVVGDHVNVRVNSGAPATALRIDIDLAALVGKVSAISGNDITLVTNKGFSRTVAVSATTTYVMGGNPATLANVTVGSSIVAVGLIGADLTTLDATKIYIRQEAGHSVTYHGVITAVSTTSLTVNRNDGVTTTFTITPSTVITEGSASMTVPSLAVGDTVNVEVNSTNPTTALRIDIVVATLGGKVSAISGNDITITGGQGFARAIQVSASTTYTEGGAAATLADIVVGSNIVAVGTIDADKTTLDATSVTIKNSGHNETIHGLVTGVTTTSFTLNRSNGTTTTFAITPSTTFSEGSTVLSIANLVVGDSANVTVNSTQPTTAISVDILLATLAGHVTNVSGNTITITAGKGFSRTIFVSATTTYSESGAPATLANVTIGSYISAQGTVDVDLTSLDATTVTIGK
jgi:hypothetical protein